MTPPHVTAGRRPLVSGVTIFLNAERFIEEAVDSVLAQTYGSWELLLVDDGSTDGSTAIARHYAERHPDRIRYLEHPGHATRGMSASRNLGVRHARGDYVAFLDADDVWLPRKLEQQVAILEAHPEAAMVYGRTQAWYSWTGRPEDLRRDSVAGLGVPPGSFLPPPTLLAVFLRNEAASPCTCSVLVRREVVEHLGGFEDAFSGLYEDMVFHAKVFLNAPVFVSGHCWDRYRQHPHSFTAVARRAGECDAGWLFFLKWLEGYLSARGMEDTRVWKLLQRKLKLLRWKLWLCRYPMLYSLASHMEEGFKLIARRTLPRLTRRWLRAPHVDDPLPVLTARPRWSGRRVEDAVELDASG